MEKKHLVRKNWTGRNITGLIGTGPKRLQTRYKEVETQGIIRNLQFMTLPGSASIETEKGPTVLRFDVAITTTAA